jgi:hypothetical protein
MNRMGTLAGAALGLLIAELTAAVLLHVPRSAPPELRGRIRAVLAVLVVITGAVGALARDGGDAYILGAVAVAVLGSLYITNGRFFLVSVGGGYVLSGVAVMTTLPGAWDVGRTVAAIVLGAVLAMLCVFSLALIMQGVIGGVAAELIRRARERQVIETALAAGALTLCYLLFNTSRPAPVLVGAVLLIVVAFSLLGENFATAKLAVGRGAALLVAVMSIGVTTTASSVEKVVPGNAATTAATTTPPTAVDGATTNDEQLAECAAIPLSRYLEQRDCYSAYFVARGEAVGTDPALEELIAVHKSSTAGPKFRPHCHEVLHDFAKARTAKEGVDALLGSYVITCTGGFAHGILTAYTAEVGWASIEENLTTFCGTLTQRVIDAMIKKGKPRPEETGWLKWNCDHMLGHLVYENTRDDLNAGAQLCASWALDTSELDSCGAGFFMEHFLDVTRNQNGWTAPRQESDVFKSCNAITGAIKEWCYSESGVSASLFASYNYPRAAALCNDFVPDEYQMVCYGSIGRILVVTNGYSPEKSIATCLTLSAVEPQAQDACLEEVAGSMLSETFAPDAAEQACDAVIDPKNMATCHERRIALEKQIAGSGLGGGTGRVES